MIDVALAGINSFASRGKRLRQSEYILDKPCSQNQEDADFRKYIASKIAKKTLQKRYKPKNILADGNALLFIKTNLSKCRYYNSKYNISI
jgi:hypothetical protein